MESVLFTNWTDKDFTYQWAKEDYNFPKGRSVYLPGYLAEHFAKHLVDRELNDRGIPTDDQSRIEMTKKCFLETKKDESELKAEVGNLNRNAEAPKEEPKPMVSDVSPVLSPRKVFCDQCDSKGVRHKKDCPALLGSPA